MSDTMRALVWSGKNQTEFIEKPIPVIRDERDAIVKVKFSSICTSDLHIIKGVVPRANQGIVLGHEFAGEVIETGSAIKTLKAGDRVSANCETFCGECFYCKKGYINNCINGGWELGCRIDGCHAEYVRVPYADTGLVKLPDNLSYKKALFTGDILSSGYFGAELCEIKPDYSVAVIGCGPVGLCAMQCARLMGAEKIIALDIEENRLRIAKENNLADIIINPSKEDYQSIIKQNTHNRGADGVIECAGNNDSFRISWEIARANAIVAIVAMYENPQTLPLPDMYGKNLIFKTGGVDAIHCKELLNYISKGLLNTDFLISEEISFNNIQEGYNKFSAGNPEILKLAVYY